MAVMFQIAMRSVMLGRAQSIYDRLSAPERRAVDLVHVMLDSHNSADGTGLFIGASRYAVLEERLQLAAVRSLSVRQFWGLAARLMKFPLTPTALDARILDLLDGDDDGTVLARLSDQASVVVMIARSLHNERKAERRAALNGADLDQPPPL